MLLHFATGKDEREIVMEGPERRAAFMPLEELGDLEEGADPFFRFLLA